MGLPSSTFLQNGVFCHRPVKAPCGTILSKMKFTVEPAMVVGCDCKPCRAGRHIYYLCRYPAEEGDYCAISFQTYSSAEECKKNHYWGMQFGPDDTWEDGTPIVH